MRYRRNETLSNYISFTNYPFLIIYVQSYGIHVQQIFRELEMNTYLFMVCTEI
jgi:hypothetical protein